MKAVVATVGFLAMPTIALAQFATFPVITESVRSQSQIENFGRELGAAEAAKARPLLPIALQMVKSFEKWEPAPYNDPNYCTIGYGHLIALARCETLNLNSLRDGLYARPWTEPFGSMQLDKDMVAPRLAIQRLVTSDLSDEQFSALASFVFNVG
jgi:lysozyme